MPALNYTVFFNFRYNFHFSKYVFMTAVFTIVWLKPILHVQTNKLYLFKRIVQKTLLEAELLSRKAVIRMVPRANSQSKHHL